MQLSIETSILVSALGERWGKSSTVLGLVKETEARICLDERGRILAAYSDQLGEEVFEKWSVDFSPQFEPGYTSDLPAEHSHFLSEHGCLPDPEQVFLAVAMESGQTVITENCRHGKGRDKASRSCKEIRQYLENSMGLCVHDAREAIRSLSRHLSGLELLNELRGTLFEYEVGQFLHRRGFQSVECRRHPPFLREKGLGEVDIVAYQDGSPRRVVVCECKLRVGNLDRKPIAGREVRRFAAKAAKIREDHLDEARRWGRQVSFQAWLVSNASTADDDAWQTCRSDRIKLMVADLPGDWLDRADWQVSRLVPMQRPRER